jgi:hypothetical protein
MLKTVTNIINASQITGVLPVVNGGTGVTTSTGTGSVVLSDSPTLTGTLATSAVFVGVGGTGATDATLKLNGSSAANQGAAIRLDRNSVNKAYIGTASYIIGGTSDTPTLWANNGLGWDIWANATLALSISSAGNLLVGVATANANGGVLQLKSGITFPATAVAATDANTLDDYEEGTWTPVYEGLAGSIGATAGTASGSYTKIGRQVIANGQIILTNKGSWTSVVRIAGLPFTVGSSVPCAGPCTLGEVVYDGTNLATYAIGASTNFYIDVSKPVVARAVLSTTAVTNTSEFYFTVIYNV